MSTNKPRVTITLNAEMKEYFTKKSKLTGVRQATLISLAVSKFLENEKKFGDYETVMKVEL